MRKVHYWRRAREDVVQYGVYLAQHSITAAEQFVDAVERACQELLEFPGMGAMARLRAADVRNVRKLSVPGFANLIIFYRERDDGIEVLRVLHGARDIESILAEEEPEPE